MKQVFIMEGLTCANCSAKIADRIRQLDGIQSAEYVLATQKMHIETNIKDLDGLIQTFQEICDAIEDGVVVKLMAKENQATGSKDTIYLLEGLTCANCSAKITDRIRALDNVKSAEYTLATQQLRLEATIPDNEAFKKELQNICDAIEEGVTVKDYKRPPKKAVPTSGQGIPLKEKIFMILAAIILFYVSISEYVPPMALPENVEAFILIAIYFLLAYEIIWGAFKRILKREWFDENFLMSIATLGALVIGEYPEAVGVIFFYRIGEIFEKRATERSRSEILGAVDMRPQEVRLVKDNEVFIVNPDEVEIGDIIEVRAGDLIPLDGTVVEGNTRINTAPVTGEPVPIAAGPGSALLSGCINESGRITLRVDHELSQSMVTKILDSVENAAASKPRIDRFITRFARVYTPIVVLIALLTAVIPPLLGLGSWDHWIYTALTFLVISCPCALVLSVPLAFFSGIGAASKQGILLKGGLVLEALAKIKAVALDKTGTITTGNFAVQSIEAVNGSDELSVLKYAAALEILSNHPIAVSIAQAAKEKNIFISKADQVEEFAGEGLIGLVEGHQVALGNRRLMDRLEISNYPEQMADYGTEILVALDGSYVGNILIADSLRPDSAQAISALKAQGIDSIMLTGDNQNSANHIAQLAGVSSVKAQLLPQDKLSAVQDIRRQYGPTMFVGDGINDAPVLAGADVGGAMGSGADAAIEASDVVFMRSSLQAVSNVMKIAYDTVHIAWQNVIFAILVKIIIMVAGLLGYASMWWAVFGDTGVSILCILNSIRILYKHQ